MHNYDVSVTELNHDMLFGLKCLSYEKQFVLIISETPFKIQKTGLFLFEISFFAVKIRY